MSGKTRKRKKTKSDVCLTSSMTTTTTHSSPTGNPSSLSASPPGAKQRQRCLSRTKKSDADSVDSQCSKSISLCRGQSCNKTECVNIKNQQSVGQTMDVDAPQRSRPRFELKLSDAEEQDGSLDSSDLSMELSPDEKHRPSLSFQPESESEEDQDEDLPSFLMQMDKKPVSVTEGTFVWHKFRKYPFWPALVKSVNRRLRKASIIFIDDLRIHKKKGFSVALKLLKPFDCDEAEELMSEAKEKSEAVLKWSTDLIADYRIRIACGSFSGSFVDYFAHDMSYPVRRKYPQEASERFIIPSDAALEEFCVALDESLSEENGTVVARSRRTLPDRTSAAHNRATGRLVYYIVDQRLVEDRLLAVLRGQQQSRWLQAFLSTNKNRRVVNYYLEDDHQLDQVYCYLNQLYAAEMSTAACLTQVSSMERVPFVLDVLLPEAIIYAIAGVEKVSVQTAEEKYLKGRSLSHRERQEFDIMIEQLVQQRSDDQNSSLSLLPPCDCT